jgi:hypothetical protein
MDGPAAAPAESSFPKGFIAAIHRQSNKTFLRRLCRLPRNARIAKRREVIAKATQQQRKLLLQILHSLAVGDIFVPKSKLEETKCARKHIKQHFGSQNYKTLLASDDQHQINVLVGVNYYCPLFHYLWHL